ncbi:MAG TPA: hypothetical protein VJ845_01680 [Haploplasma sp.]|nr:hypothetical protein [Haploplasma sp.]
MTTSRGALLLYTNEGDFNNMSVVLNLSAHKKAGQGFGSATGQYMDVYIKYDTKTSSGYGLRIQRVSDYGNAVTFTLMEFTNGIGTKLTEAQVSSAFVTNCTVELDIINNVFTTKVTTTTEQSPGQIEDGHLKEVNLTTTIKNNSFGSFGVQHTGTVSAGNRTMLHDVLIKY